MGKKAAAKSSSGSLVNESRIDPADGQQLTYDEVRQKYAKVYKEFQIVHYWKNDCRRAPQAPKSEPAPKEEVKPPAPQPEAAVPAAPAPAPKEEAKPSAPQPEAAVPAAPEPAPKEEAKPPAPQPEQVKQPLVEEHETAAAPEPVPKEEEKPQVPWWALAGAWIGDRVNDAGENINKMQGNMPWDKKAADVVAEAPPAEVMGA